MCGAAGKPYLSWFFGCARHIDAKDFPFFPPHHKLKLSSRLSESRSGEICNACVLLVKRWKKLPVGTKKNWNHVSFSADSMTGLSLYGDDKTQIIQIRPVSCPSSRLLMPEEVPA